MALKQTEQTVTPEAAKKAKAAGDFFAKLQSEGKLDEFLKRGKEKSEGTCESLIER